MSDTEGIAKPRDWDYSEVEDGMEIEIDGKIFLFTCIELLRYCDDSGEGTLALSQKFLNESNLFKADVIQDWISELVDLYNQILEEGI